MTLELRLANWFMWHERHERLWLRRCDPGPIEIAFDYGLDKAARKVIFSTRPGGDLIALNDELLDWCLDNTPSLRISHNPYQGKASFFFGNESEAVLFKLRWC